MEKYATFSDGGFTKERELNFSSTSADLNKANSKVLITWKE
jgi:hypothetical protein